MIRTIRDLMDTAYASTEWANFAELPEARQKMAAVAAALTEAGIPVEQTVDSIEVPAWASEALRALYALQRDGTGVDISETAERFRRATDASPDFRAAFSARKMGRRGIECSDTTVVSALAGLALDLVRSDLRLAEFEAELAAKTAEEVQSLFPEVAGVPAAAQPGDLVRVDRDKNLMADPQGFGTWENFEAAANAAGLELDQHPGNDREGWRVVAVAPRTGPNRPEGKDGPPPPPDPAMERVWID
jgi:hypothetical protein